MEKPSGSKHKQGLVSSIQPLSQATMDQLEIDDPLANCKNDLDQLTQIWGSTDQNTVQVLSSNDMKIEMAKVDVQLEQANVKIDRLKAKYHRIRKNNEALRKFIDGEAKTRRELIEKQNISENRRLLIGDHIAAIKNVLKEQQENIDQLKQMYDLILKNDEEIKDLKKKCTGPLVISEKEKVLEDQIALMEKAISQVQIKHQDLQNQSTQIIQNMDKKSCECEELKKTMCENQEIYDKEMEKLSNTVKNIDARLNKEQEENSKLLIRNNESSEKSRELLTEYQAQLGRNTETAKQIEDLKFQSQELKEKQKNLESEIEELKSASLAVTSERDLKLANYRTQLQDLTSEHTETTNKLIKVTSNNEKLSDTLIAKKMQRDELKKAFSNKDDKLTDLRNNLNDAKLLNTKLTAETQSLDEKLIRQRNLLSQTNADLKTFYAKENENSQRESELGTRLAIAKQNLEKKITTITELRNELSIQKSNSLKERKKFEQDLEQKDKQINEFRKIRENLQKEKERIDSENNKKLQKTTQSSMECQRAGHQKRIDEQIVKIDILKQQISAEKLKVKQENIDKPDGKMKEQCDAQLNEIKSDIDDIEKVISETKEQQKDLRATLKKIETFNEAKNSIVQESLNSSSLLGIIYGQSQSKPASSTPEHNQDKENVVFDSISDVSSIMGGSDIFEDAERRYSQYLENNKTDNAKLNQPDRKDKFDELKHH